MQVFHRNPFDGKSPHSFNDFFLGVYTFPQIDEEPNNDIPLSVYSFSLGT